MKNLTSFLILSLFFITCRHEPEDNASMAEIPKTSNSEAGEDLPEGETYSDSMVQSIVNEALESNQPIQIDSFRDLHTFDKTRFKIKGLRKINLETVEQYKDAKNPVSKAQRQLLGITDYFLDLTCSDEFSMYLFYNKSEESHYGNSIELITIAKRSNQTDRLVLAQEYLSEGYETTVESEIIGKNTFRLKKTEYFGIGNDARENRDSVRVHEEKYQVNKFGAILKMKQ